MAVFSRSDDKKPAIRNEVITTCAKTVFPYHPLRRTPELLVVRWALVLIDFRRSSPWTAFLRTKKTWILQASFVIKNEITSASGHSPTVSATFPLENKQLTETAFWSRPIKHTGWIPLSSVYQFHALVLWMGSKRASLWVNSTMSVTKLPVLKHRHFLD